VTVVKNKLSPPFRKAFFDFLFTEGVSRAGELIDLGVDAGIIRKSGSWYTYGGEQLGQGKENTRKRLRESPELALEIEAKVMTGLAELKAQPPGKAEDQSEAALFGVPAAPA
jgi:recombination protein RecA